MFLLNFLEGVLLFLATGKVAERERRALDKRKKM
jgi:hypothetical protein